MLGYLSRGQILDLETLLNAPRVRFSGRYVDPYRFAVMSSAATTTTSNIGDAAASSSTKTTTTRKTTREVFEETWGWSSTQAANFVLWWAFRPTSCASCGGADVWMPCPDTEYLCPLCCVGAGTTRVHTDIVMDRSNAQAVEQQAGGAFGRGGFDNSDDSDDGGSDNDRDGVMDADAGGGGGMFGLAAQGLSSGNVYAAASPLVTQLMTPISLTHWVVAFLRRLRLQHFGVASQLDSTMFPAIVRVSLNLINLLHLPDMGTDSIETLKAACLYVACSVVVPSVVSFPCLQAAASISPSSQQLPQQHQQQQQDQTGGVECDVHWCDVVYVSSMVGVEVDDFFAGDSRQHTRNLVCLMDCQPSGLLYDSARTPVATAVLAEMARKQRGEAAPAAAQQQQQTSKDGSNNNNNNNVMPTLERFSPDHTAAIFVLECGRQQPDRVKEWKSKRDAELSGGAAAVGGDSSINMTTATPAAAANNIADSSSQQNTLTLIDDPCLWQLLVSLADAVRMTPAAFADLVDRSGLYGAKLNFTAVLQRRLSMGEYLLPLARRASPCASPWNAVFRALHSDEDRLPLLSALTVLAQSPTTEASKRNNSAALQLVQQILRKHGALFVVTFNYVLHVTDASFQNFQGLYFCTQVDRRGALYLSLTQPRSIRFMGASKQVYLNEASERNDARLVASTVGCTTAEPITVAIESAAARLLLTAVQSSGAAGGGDRGDRGRTSVGNNSTAMLAWSDAAAKLSVCAQLRRRAAACLPVDDSVQQQSIADQSTGDANSNQQQQHQQLHDVPLQQVAAGGSGAHLVVGSAAHPSNMAASASAGASYAEHNPAVNNKYKSALLFNTKSMLAHERRNPGWTTQLVLPEAALGNTCSVKNLDSQSLGNELASHGVFLGAAATPFEQRLRAMSLAAMPDVEVMAAHAMVMAVQEQQQQQQKHSPAMMGNSSSSRSASDAAGNNMLPPAQQQRRSRSPTTSVNAGSTTAGAGNSAATEGKKNSPRIGGSGAIASPRLTGNSGSASPLLRAAPSNAGTGSSRVSAMAATTIAGINVSTGLPGTLPLPVLARDELQSKLL